jgi:hypothetical protein
VRAEAPADAEAAHDPQTVRGANFSRWRLDEDRALIRILTTPGAHTFKKSYEATFYEYSPIPTDVESCEITNTVVLNSVHNN